MVRHCSTVYLPSSNNITAIPARNGCMQDVLDLPTRTYLICSSVLSANAHPYEEVECAARCVKHRSTKVLLHTNPVAIIESTTTFSILYAYKEVRLCFMYSLLKIVQTNIVILSELASTVNRRDRNIIRKEESDHFALDTYTLHARSHRTS